MKKDRLSKICEVVIDFYRIREKFEKEFRYYRKEGKFRFEMIDTLESELYHLKSKTHDAFRYDPDSKSKILESEDLFLSCFFSEIPAFAGMTYRKITNNKNLPLL